MLKQKKKGFSLIELMVVIAIMGILATVAVTYLREAQIKSRFTASLTSAASAVPYLVDCSNMGLGLKKPAPGFKVCEDIGEWPVLETNFKYKDKNGEYSQDCDDLWFGISYKNDSKPEYRAACDLSGCKNCKETPEQHPCEKIWPPQG